MLLNVKKVFKHVDTKIEKKERNKNDYINNENYKTLCFQYRLHLYTFTTLDVIYETV